MDILGIDIGGSGIKGAPVNVESGEMLAERFRVATPRPSKPSRVAKTVADIAQHFEWNGKVGCGFPSAMRAGVALTAANVHKKWIGTDAAALFSEATGCSVSVVNDADAAGLAEVRFGAGRDHKGVIIVITIGTGLGTALFVDGRLFPNAELGHLEMDGKEAEWHASDAARKRDKLSWEEWGIRFNRYLHELERLLWPDMIILGGGISKRFPRFQAYLDVGAQVLPAQLLNDAGIVGAALAADSNN